MDKKKMEPLVLASSSPRRRELLSSLQIPFEVIPSAYEEVFDDSPPIDQALFLAGMKTQRVLEDNPKLEKRLVLGADTVLDVDGRLVGKPADRTTACRFLELLSGRTHRVITALSIRIGFLGKTLQQTETTTVRFAELSQEEIEWYLTTGEWEGAAGAYRIQGKGSFLVEGIDGCFFNVVGLPIRLFYGILQSQGVSLTETL